MQYSTLALLLLCLGGTFAKPSSLPEVIENCFGGKCQQNNGGSEDFEGFEGWPSGGQPGLGANSGEGGFGQWPFGGPGGFGGFPNNAFGPEPQQEPLGVSALGARYRTRPDVSQDVAASQELDSATTEDRIRKVEKEPKFEEELKQEEDEEGKDEEDEKDKEEEEDEQNDEPEEYQKENHEEGQEKKEEELKLEESAKPITTANVIDNCFGGTCQQNNGGSEGLDGFESFNGWPSGGQSGFGDNNGELSFGQWPFGGSGGFGGFPQQEPLGNSALGDLYRTRQAVTQDLAASLELKSSATEDRSRKVVESQDDQREIMVEEKINLEEELEQQEKQEEEDQEDKEEQEEDQNDELKGYQEKDQEEEHE